MRKKLSLLTMFIFFSITTTFANENEVLVDEQDTSIEMFTDCVDFAFGTADRIYGRTGDGFAAAEAFGAALEFCEKWLI